MNSQQQYEFKLPQRKQQIQIEVSIRFGNPKYSDCRNFGICKIYEKPLSNVASRLKDHFANALMVFERGTLEIYFIKASMSRRTCTHYFGSDYFKVENEKKIPSRITKQFYPSITHIPNQEYIVTKTVNYYMITIFSYGEVER